MVCFVAQSLYRKSTHTAYLPSLFRFLTCCYITLYNEHAGYTQPQVQPSFIMEDPLRGSYCSQWNVSLSLPFLVIGCSLVYMLLLLSEIIHMLITYWS